MSDGFNPDWTVAPAASLREILKDRGLTAAEMASAVSPETSGATAAILQAVLDKQPYGTQVAELLARATGTSVAFWENYERNYREGLAIGRKDVTGTG